MTGIPVRSCKTRKLGNLAEEVRQLYNPKRDEALPYVGLEHIEQGTLSLNGFGQSSDTVSTKKIFQPGDILFGSLRPYFRKVVRVKFAGVCSTDITVIRPLNHTDPNFLFYLIANQPFIDLANNISSGTRMPRANWKTLCKSEWPTPTPTTQNKIGAILSAYDDLIENNTRRINILEEMAQLIYREWFVNFHFPGHENVKMIKSELGMIPEGWEVKRLNEICTIIMGQSPSSEFYNEHGEGLPFHQGVTNFGQHFPSDQVFCTAQNRIAKRGDILFSVRAPVGRINVANKKIIIGRGLCAIRSINSHQAFILYQLREKFKEEDSMGGGTIFKAVTKDDMYSIKMLVPAEPHVSGFKQIVEPIIAQLEVLTNKNANLRATRDLLLPKLISGEVDVEKMDIKTETIEA